jgi:dienelactone hydrolase
MWCISKPVLPLSLVLTACLFTGAMGIVRAQTLEVVPNRVLSDESAVIRASGLQPAERIIIRAELVDGGGQPWASEAAFIADAQGIVDASKQAPVEGSYAGVSAMGLIWSMKPAAKHVSMYEHSEKLVPQTISFRLMRKGEAVATAELEQVRFTEGTRRIDVEGQLHGVLFVPNTNGRHPGVLVVGGSEGGVPLPKAAWLASHGFAALALAYFRYADLPRQLEAIPLEYFGRAIGWMMDQPDISADRIAVMGTSRGGELALQLGSLYPQIKAVVAYVPANVRYPACCINALAPAWTWHGAALSYQSARFRSQEAVMGAAIDVEQTHGPILLISGQDDGVWPSSMMADAAVARLKQHHFAYPVEHLKYAHAGHAVGRPEIVPAWHGKVTHPVSGRETDLGGTPAGDIQSSLDAIPKVLAFLRQSLASTVSEQRIPK